MRYLKLGRPDFFNLSEEILSRKGSLRFEAHGASMFPFIRDGDLLTVQPVEAVSLHVGEVIFYRGAGDRLFAHRIVGRTLQDGLITFRVRGDGASGLQEWIRVEQVLGRVVSVQRAQRVIRVNQGLWRLAGRLWSTLQPLEDPLLRVARSVRLLLRLRAG